MAFISRAGPVIGTYYALTWSQTLEELWSTWWYASLEDVAALLEVHDMSS